MNGDTPDDARQAIRKQGHVVVTNRICCTRESCLINTIYGKNYSYLKIYRYDELHSYRGIFGVALCQCNPQAGADFAVFTVLIPFSFAARQL